jgi:hypothetical protein
VFVETNQSLSTSETKQLFSFVSQNSKFVVSLRAIQVLKDLEQQVQATQIKQITGKIEATGVDLSELISKKARFVLHGKCSYSDNSTGVISKHSLVNDLANELAGVRVEEIKFVANRWDTSGKNILDI